MREKRFPISCTTCRRTYLVTAVTKERQGGKYCSEACRPKTRRAICEICHKEFACRGPRKGPQYKRSNVFCSIECRGKRGISGQERFIKIMGTAPPDASQCWIWKGQTFNTGYGYCFDRGKDELAHRIAYEVFKGPIPPGLHVLHHCDTRLCQNPAHLYVGDNNDNIRDKLARGRQSRGIDHPYAKLTEQQVREIRAMAAQGMHATAIAKHFPVSRESVRDTISGKQWKHVV